MMNNGLGATPEQLGVRPAPALAQRFLTHAFGWMFAGLLLTAGVAYAVQASETLTQFASRSYFLLFIGQIALVWIIVGAINRLSASAALALFFVYAATLGLTVGLVVQAYTGASVTTAFVSASAMFGAAALYGATTRRSLASVGAIAFMALIGLLVAMIVNLFLHSDQVTWLISIAGVVIFTALTAYDVQRIQNGTMAAVVGSLEKGSVIGALALYLDFINLFFFLLRLTGGRR